VAAYQRTPPGNHPPLLGTIASNLAGTTLSVRCRNQSAPVRKQSGRQLSISNRVCAILDGYALANPWVPRADQPAGLVIAETAFNFLRGVARAAGTRATQIDCRALNDLYPAFLTLGATPRQARALHRAATPLSRQPCP
jgi:hypothetical protein